MLDSALHSTTVISASSKFLYADTIDAYAGSWLEISSTAFNHNIACFADRMTSAVDLAVIIKSNGYGHGIDTMALLCQQNKQVTWIGTSTLSEALRMCALGVTKPILVLSHIDADPNLVHGNNIIIAVHDLQSAQRLSAIATGTFRVHIKIDTGLSRFGIPAENAVTAIKQIMSLPHIQVEGIYTHFAASGDLAPTALEEQNKLFNMVLDELALSGIRIPVRHAAKSVVAACVAQTRYSFVRLGAGAYGLCAQEIGLPLRQILTWKARIMHIRNVPAGAYIGYNRTYQATSDRRIAVLPIGYYEGYPLSLSNKGKVYVCRSGHFVPVVGRVCMNQIMIDITDCPSSLTVGDEVELIGDRPGITIADLARASGSNNERELVARLNPLLSRIVV